MRILWLIVTAVCILAGLPGGNGAQAASDIRLLSSTALNEIMQVLAPQFTRATGHTLVMEFESSTVVKRKIEAGAKFDIAIATPVMIADLARQGKLTVGPEIARGGFGVAIRAGAARPDISTTAAFRATVLGAKSIIYSKDGQSGQHMVSVLERLGIAEQMRPRIVERMTSGPVAENVARGEAELGFQSISEILSAKGAELLGPLPAELQGYITLAAGLVVDPQGDPQRGAATQDLWRFLATPAAAEVMKKYGMESLAR